MRILKILPIFVFICFGCTNTHKTLLETETSLVTNRMANYLISNDKMVKSIKDNLSKQREYVIYTQRKTSFLSYEDFTLQVAKKACNCDNPVNYRQYITISDSLKHIDSHLITENQVNVKANHKVISSKTNNNTYIKLYLFVGKPFKNTIRLTLSSQKNNRYFYQFNSVIEYLIYYDKEYNVLDILQNFIVYG